MPQDVFPDSAIYERRKCPRCAKEKTFLKSDTRKYCEECRHYARSYKHQHKVYKLDKVDQAQVEREKQQKARDFHLRYGTESEDCALWRSYYDKIHDWRTDEDEADRLKHEPFYLNHIGACRLCSAWYVKSKGDSLDLNGTRGKGDDKFDELSAYEEAFSPPKQYVEDYVHSPHGSFRLGRTCYYCNYWDVSSDGTCPRCGANNGQSDSRSSDRGYNKNGNGW